MGTDYGIPAGLILLRGFPGLRFRAQSARVRITLAYPSNCSILHSDWQIGGSLAAWEGAFSHSIGAFAVSQVRLA
jgi:hypothetical protein